MMVIDLGRIQQRQQINIEDLPILIKNAADAAKDSRGESTSAVGTTLRSMGLCGYLLDSDFRSFRKHLRESASIQLKLFERFEAGEPIDPSYVTMLAYKDLFDALAAGDFELSSALARHMGGRDEIEEQFDHPFTIDMGYTLKWFVCDDATEAQEWLARLRALCRGRRIEDVTPGNFVGYADVFSALLGRDLPAANKGFKTLVRGHEKESKGGGMFANLLDRYLCVWGIGMANLCRWRGLKVSAVPPLIPENLLI